LDSLGHLRSFCGDTCTAGECAGGARQGHNDFGKIGYNGPCPPRGAFHRYFFRLYALDAKLGLEPGAGKGEVERAMKGHILAKAELMGKFRG
jgi:Raf kinase inhibitor-like YbhB/YbcL family protein